MGQGWIGIAIGLLGIAVTVVLYIHARSKRQLAVQGRSVPLVNRSPEAPERDLQVTFKGREVPCLWRTTIVIWNDGNTTLRGDDLVQADLLRISHEGIVFDAKITRLVRTATGFRVKVSADEKDVLFDFDFLDPGDGAVVDILHTDAAGDGYLCGTLIGVPTGWTNKGNIPITPFDHAERGGRKGLLLFPILFAPLGVLVVIGGLFPDLVLEVMPFLGRGGLPRLVPGRVDWTFAVLGAMLTLFSTRILLRVRSGPPTALLEAASGRSTGHRKGASSGSTGGVQEASGLPGDVKQ